MVGSQRIEYIDLAKGFCIIFVVMAHISNNYNIDFWLNDKITAFRMPLYYFLSGVFFKSYNGFKNFLKKKTNKLLIPFLFFYLTTSCLLPYLLDIVKGNNSTSYSSFMDLLTSVYYESFSNSAIWFLLSLFLVNMLFYLFFCSTNLIAQNKTFVIVLVAMTIGCIGLLLSYLKINLPLYMDSSLTALPFFMAGYIVKNKTNLMSPNKLDKYTLLVIIICFTIVCAFSDGNLFFAKNIYSQRSIITLYPIGIIGTIGILYCAKYITRLPFVSYLGRYSIIVLVTHGIIFTNLRHHVVSLMLSETRIELQFVVTFVLTLGICFLLIPIIKRFLPYVTAQKDIIK